MVKFTETARAVALVSFVSCASAWPSLWRSEKRVATQKITINYNFEQVERADPVSATTPIDIYNLLNFPSIAYVGSDPDMDGNHLGSAPHSYAAMGAFGGPYSAITGQPGVVTVEYTNSHILSFTPISFWYGCVAPSPVSAGSIPETCTVTATGMGSNGQIIATQKYPFKANGSLVQDQNLGYFKGFKDIHTLSLSVTNSGFTAVVIDNLIATLTQNAAGPFNEPASYTKSGGL